MEEAGDGSEGAPERSSRKSGVRRGGVEGEGLAGAGGEAQESILSGGGEEIGIHTGVGGAVSGDDNVFREKGVQITLFLSRRGWSSEGLLRC